MSPARLLKHIAPKSDGTETPKSLTALLSPAVIAVTTTIAVHIVGYVVFMATLEARVVVLEKRVIVAEQRLAGLDREFVPRAEHLSRDAERAKLEEARDRRLDRLEGKMDLLLETMARR